MDTGTLILLSSLGGGSISAIATLLITAVIVRFVYHTWQDFDSLRTQALAELRMENADLRRRMEALEKQQGK